ncbi:MAG: hypothetical protein QGH29_10525 [Kiritimatiellia bacterium]|nr:hypothetical protein [Kiritimatiellia bacterium]
MRKATYTMKWMATTLVLCLMAGAGMAATYVEDDWSETEGWTATAYGGHDAAGTVLDAGIVDGQAALQIDADAADAGLTDRIFTDTDVATGTGTDLTNYDFGADGGNAVGAVDFITFEFYANANDGDDLPAALYFYFESLAGSLWRLNIYSQLSNPGGWNDISVSMADAGWVNILGGEADLETTLLNVDDMGIMLTYEGVANQEYGIDNYRMHYPEPGTYAVLAFALLSLGVTFRGKLRTSVKDFLKK